MHVLFKRLSAYIHVRVCSSTLHRLHRVAGTRDCSCRAFRCSASGSACRSRPSASHAASVAHRAQMGSCMFYLSCFSNTHTHECNHPQKQKEKERERERLLTVHAQVPAGRTAPHLLHVLSAFPGARRRSSLQGLFLCFPFRISSLSILRYVLYCYLNVRCSATSAGAYSATCTGAVPS